MSKPDALTYHTRRATRELDMGLIADTGAASRAHLQLASMHLQRVRELSGSAPSLCIVD